MEGRPETHQFWAKLEYESDTRRPNAICAWHPLIAHSADVAAVMEGLLRDTILGKRLARLAGWEALSDIHLDRLCALAAIHDAGKANHGFQDRAFSDGARRTGHQKPIIEAGDDDELCDLAYLPLRIGPMMRWFDDPIHLKSMLRATWSHHGTPVKPGAPTYSIWDPNDRRVPADELERLGIAVQSWFPDAFQPGDRLPEACSAFEHAFNGALTLADWRLRPTSTLVSGNSAGSERPERSRKSSTFTSRVCLDAPLCHVSVVALRLPVFLIQSSNGLPR